MPLSVPLPDPWPLVLCGPMLRRVTPTSACVFVALSRPCDVRLDVVEPPFDPRDPDVPVATASAATVALGERLHVVAVEAKLDGAPMRPGVVYEYDLAFTDAAGTETLDTVGLLSDDRSLGYAEGRRPSFALPPALSDLELVHGSCRMPHTAGQDMLAALDPLIEAARDDPFARPHQLLLTGDQIYADDVSVCLLDVLVQTAAKLLGWEHEERVTLDGAAGREVGPNDPALAPGIARGDFMKQEAKLTSGELDGHLLFLGEYYAMYLFSWSDALWPRTEDPADPLTFDLPPVREAARGGWYKPTLLDYLTGPSLPPLEQSAFRDEDAVDCDRDGTLTTIHLASNDRRYARAFAQTLWRVRRALANVPTLMLFDDHEVTDDWYLNGEWDTSIRSSGPGRRVLRNGLAAYAVFQDWGNHPERYEEGTLGATLLAQLTHDPAAGGPPLGPELESVLDTGAPATPRAGRDARMCWDWRYEGPAHRIVALDTRTWRAFDGAPRDAARLMSAEALDEQLGEPDPARLTIVLSPPPVLGFPFVEEGVQRFFVSELGQVYDKDNEPWGANRDAFEDFLRRLARHERVVLLGGDVHYAFTNHCAYFRDDGQTPERARLVQLCATSLHHETSLTRINGYIGNVAHRTYGWLGWNEAIPAARRRDLRAACVHMAPAFSLLVEDRFSAPAVLPATRWQNPDAAAIVENLADGTHGIRTAWRYRVEFVRDEAPSRFGTVVGANNLALVTFPAGAVEQRLLWQVGDGDPSGDALPAPYETVHRAPLTLPTDAEKPVVSAGE